MQILLVEDDERIVNFVKRGLEAERFRVDVARNGQEAIDTALAVPYRMIILDLALPIKSGLEVCQFLREKKVEMPILILTATDNVEEKVKTFSIGADDYLTKPFAFEELLARVKALMRRGPYREERQTLQVADLTLNPESHEVHRKGKLISLTAKEFALLEYLMMNPNKVLNRTTLLEKVWGYHYDTLTNVVDVYIRYLRKKVDEGYPKRLIQTVRDVGYKICE
ncbi:MAG: response regulator transcription factor [Candidatus Manganitrophaceae bacterium]